ncbi:MAG: FKBP-type peptidyl-prolyl cis-trans isomerase, partial [Nocardioides sp.]|nr:FKBP-type peptidyl-prolyl cis-trans isomerase [Nocardioides sp.]
MPRVLALISALSLVLVGLSACGSDDESGNSGEISVSGEFGAEPTVKYDGRVERSDTEVDVLSEGDGDTVAAGDAVMAHYYVGNGYVGEKAISTWDPAPQSGRVTSQVLELGKESIPALKKAIIDQKVGSRVVVEASPEDAYGDQGNPTLFISPGDTVVFVVDILAKLEPEIAKKTDAGAGRPVIKFAKGVPSSFDFSKAPAGAPRLQKITLVQGKGDPVKKGEDLAMRYLGSVWGSNKVFDENYSKDITPFQIGAGSLIPAWDKLLVGVKAGSRVMLIVPSEFGYGEDGRGEDIKPGDDLVFVVDVLGSTPASPQPV